MAQKMPCKLNWLFMYVPHHTLDSQALSYSAELPAEQTLTSLAETPFRACSFLRHLEARGTLVATELEKMETGFAQAWMCWQEPGALEANN